MVIIWGGAKGQRDWRAVQSSPKGVQIFWDLFLIATAYLIPPCYVFTSRAFTAAVVYFNPFRRKPEPVCSFVCIGNRGALSFDPSDAIYYKRSDQRVQFSIEHLASFNDSLYVTVTCIIVTPSPYHIPICPNGQSQSIYATRFSIHVASRMLQTIIPFIIPSFYSVLLNDTTTTNATKK